MKQIMILFAVAGMLVACSGNKTQGEGTDADPVQQDSLKKTKAVKAEPKDETNGRDMWTTTAVEEQIRACYSEVNKMAATDVIDIDKLDKMFCSKDFLDLKNRLEKKIMKGEVMFGGDQGYHWTAELATPLTVDSVRTELLTAEQAQSEVWLVDERGNKGYLELNLYLEGGAWKIHNWIDSEVYPFGALFHWMQNAYDGITDDEEHVEEE